MGDGSRLAAKASYRNAAGLHWSRLAARTVRGYFSKMSPTPAIPKSASADQARALLEAAGWRQVGLGDWSWVLTDPAGALAARVTPFDPAYRLHAQACLDGPPNRWLPRIDAILPLRRDGYVVIMERLWPANEAYAAAFCSALGIVNDSGYTPPPDLPFAEADDDLTVLRQRLTDLIGEGARRFKLWGGSDIRPANVMADGQGRLKLVDPVFVRGLGIVEAVRDGRLDLLADFSREQLEDFMTIPPFQPGEDTEALRRRLAELYA